MANLSFLDVERIMLFVQSSFRSNRWPNKINSINGYIFLKVHFYGFNWVLTRTSFPVRITWAHSGSSGSYLCFLQKWVWAKLIVIVVLASSCTAMQSISTSFYTLLFKMPLLLSPEQIFPCPSSKNKGSPSICELVHRLPKKCSQMDNLRWGRVLKWWQVRSNLE